MGGNLLEKKDLNMGRKHRYPMFLVKKYHLILKQFSKSMIMTDDLIQGYLHFIFIITNRTGNVH